MRRRLDLQWTIARVACLVLGHRWDRPYNHLTLRCARCGARLPGFGR